jgi:anti-anti-sigma factor
VVVDLSRVSFIDAAGISVLVTGWNYARTSNQSIHFIGAGRFVRRVLTIIGYERLLDGVISPEVTSPVAS